MFTPLRLTLSAVLTWAPIVAHADPPVVAVPTFGYVDTSGEARKQTQFHADWSRRLATELQQGLTNGGTYRGIGLDCGGAPCSAGQGDDVADLAAKARQAGARILLFGVVQKQSTLISWARVRAIDTTSGKVLFDKFLTFRGDDDAAWQHMEGYVLREFLAAGPGS